MTTTTINMDVVIRRADLDRLLVAVQPATVLKVIGLRLMEFVDESFRTRGRGGWAPLRPSTLLTRLRGGDAPLQDTGRYKQSFTTETDNQTYIEVGTNAKTESGASLGRIHELGAGPFTVRVRRARVLAAQTRDGGWLRFGKEVTITIPPRPVLPTEQQAEEILKPVLEEMLERTKDGGS